MSGLPLAPSMERSASVTQSYAFAQHADIVGANSSTGGDNSTHILAQQSSGSTQITATISSNLSKPPAIVNQAEQSRKADLLQGVLRKFKGSLPQARAEELEELMIAMSKPGAISNQTMPQLRTILGAELYQKLLNEIQTLSTSSSSLPHTTPQVQSVSTNNLPVGIMPQHKLKQPLVSSLGTIRPGVPTQQQQQQQQQQMNVATPKNLINRSPLVNPLKHSNPSPAEEQSAAKRQRLATSSADSILPQNKVTFSKSSASSTTKEDEEDEAGGDDGESQNVKALMDVTKIAGVDLKQETVLGTHEDDNDNTPVTIVPEPTFLHIDFLKTAVHKIARDQRVSKVDEDIYSFLSLAVQERMRGIIEQLVVASNHRLEVVKDNLTTTTNFDPRRALNLIVRKEKEIRERKEQEEKDRQLQEAKRLEALAKKDGNNPAYAQAKENLKRISSEGEEFRKQQATNTTALQAIGERKKTPAVRVLSTSIPLNGASSSRLTNAQLTQLAELTQLNVTGTLTPAQQSDLAWLQSLTSRGPTLPPSTVTTPQLRQIERLITKKDLLFFASIDPFLRHSRRVILQQWKKKKGENSGE